MNYVEQVEWIKRHENMYLVKEELTFDLSELKVIYSCVLGFLMDQKRIAHSIRKPFTVILPTDIIIKDDVKEYLLRGIPA